MDNLKYYNDSLAYDFKMFMPKNDVEEQKENIVKLPKTAARQKQKKAARKLSATATAVLVSTVLLAALCGNIFMRLQINEVNSKIKKVSAEINELDSEYTSLKMEFERRVSFSNLEYEAAELGMQKKTKSQVKYIRVNNKNSATTKDGKCVESKN